MDWDAFRDRVEADPLLRRLAGGSTFRLLLRRGSDERLISVRDGRIESITEGPFVMPACDFALAGSGEAWERYGRARPAPRDQDPFAFLRRGEMTVEGDTRKLFAHLLFLKLMLAKMRVPQAPA